MEKSFAKSYVIILFILFVTILGTAIFTQKSFDKSGYASVVIEHGDNLWRISKSYEELHNMSEEKFIDWVMNHNNLKESNIYPGQELLIPVKTEKIILKDKFVAKN